MRVFKAAMLAAMFAGTSHGYGIDLPKMALTAIAHNIQSHSHGRAPSKPNHLAAAPGKSEQTAMAID